MGAKGALRRRWLALKLVILAIVLLAIWRDLGSKHDEPTNADEDGGGGVDGGGLLASGSVSASAASLRLEKVEEKKKEERLRIAIITFTTKETSYTHLSLKNKHAYANRYDYSLIIDYEADDSKGLMWHKFSMIERLISAGEHDWIWWIDFDTLITNLSIKLDDIIAESLRRVNDTASSAVVAAADPGFQTKFVSAEEDGVNPDEIDFLLTADCFPLNAGSMLVRGRKPSGRQGALTSPEFLARVRAYHAAESSDAHQLSEQDCIRDMIFDVDKSYAARHVRMIPQWKMNAFPDEIHCFDQDERGWRPGTFLVHFAGAWAHLPDQEDPTGFLMRKYQGFIQK